MPRIQSRRPYKQKIVYISDVFDGGMNTINSPAKLKENEFEILQNIDLNYLSLRRRGGWKKVVKAGDWKNVDEMDLFIGNGFYWNKGQLFHKKDTIKSFLDIPFNNIKNYLSRWNLNHRFSSYFIPTKAVLTVANSVDDYKNILIPDPMISFFNYWKYNPEKVKYNLIKKKFDNIEDVKISLDEYETYGSNLLNFDLHQIRPLDINYEWNNYGENSKKIIIASKFLQSIKKPLGAVLPLETSGIIKRYNYEKNEVEFLALRNFPLISEEIIKKSQFNYDYTNNSWKAVKNNKIIAKFLKKDIIKIYHKNSGNTDNDKMNDNYRIMKFDDEGKNTEPNKAYIPKNQQEPYLFIKKISDFDKDNLLIEKIELVSVVMKKENYVISNDSWDTTTLFALKPQPSWVKPSMLNNNTIIFNYSCAFTILPGNQRSINNSYVISCNYFNKLDYFKLESVVFIIKLSNNVRGFIIPYNSVNEAYGWNNFDKIFSNIQFDVDLVTIMPTRKGLTVLGTYDSKYKGVIDRSTLNPTDNYAGVSLLYNFALTSFNFVGWQRRDSSMSASNLWYGTMRTNLITAYNVGKEKWPILNSLLTGSNNPGIFLNYPGINENTWKDIQLNDKLFIKNTVYSTSHISKADDSDKTTMPYLRTNITYPKRMKINSSNLFIYYIETKEMIKKIKHTYDFSGFLTDDLFASLKKDVKANFFWDKDKNELNVSFIQPIITHGSFDFEWLDSAKYYQNLYVENNGKYIFKFSGDKKAAENEFFSDVFIPESPLFYKIVARNEFGLYSNQTLNNKNDFVLKSKKIDWDYIPDSKKLSTETYEGLMRRGWLKINFVYSPVMIKDPNDNSKEIYKSTIMRNWSPVNDFATIKGSDKDNEIPKMPAFLRKYWGQYSTYEFDMNPETFQINNIVYSLNNKIIHYEPVFARRLHMWKNILDLSSQFETKKFMKNISSKEEVQRYNLVKKLYDKQKDEKSENFLTRDIIKAINQKQFSNINFIWNPHNKIIYYNHSNKDYYPESNRIFISESEDEFIVDIRDFLSALLVFTNQNIYLLKRQDVGNYIGFTKLLLNAGLGLINHNSVINIKDHIVFISTDFRVVKISSNYNPSPEITRNIKYLDDNVYNVLQKDLIVGDSKMINFENTLYIFVNKKCWKYYVEKKIWSVDTSKLFADVKGVFVEDNKLYLATAQGVFEYDETHYQDDFVNEPIEVVIKTRAHTLGFPSNIKKFHKLYVNLDGFIPYEKFKLFVSIFTDRSLEYNETDVTSLVYNEDRTFTEEKKPIEKDPKITVDKVKVSIGEWKVPSKLVKQAKFKKNFKGYNIQYKILYNGFQSFNLENYAIEASVKKIK